MSVANNRPMPSPTSALCIARRERTATSGTFRAGNLISFVRRQLRQEAIDKDDLSLFFLGLLVQPRDRFMVHGIGIWASIIRAPATVRTINSRRESL